MYYGCDCNPSMPCGCHGQGLGLDPFNFSPLPLELEPVPVGLMTAPGSPSGDILGMVSTGLSMAGPYGQAAAAVLQTMDKMLKWFGEGAGRKEADAIVPTQNKVGEFLAQVVSRIPYANIAEAQQLFIALQQTGAAFDQFLDDPRWTDGRASKQAHASIDYLVADNLEKLQQRILAQGGIRMSPQLTQGYGALPRLATPSSNSFPAIPQSGTIWPNAPALSIYRQDVGTIGTLGASFGTIPMVLIAGLAAAFLFNRKGAARE